MTGDERASVVCHHGMAHHGRNSGDADNYVTHSLRGEGFDASEDGTGRGTPLVSATLRSRHKNVDIEMTLLPFDTTQITSAKNRSSPQPGDPCHPLSASGHPAAVAFSPSASGKQTTLGASELSPTLKNTTPVGVTDRRGVRRLTPLESERLQGMPDDWTLVPHRCKPMADGPRYKAVGNSMAVPCMRWIGERIDRVSRLIGASNG